MLFSERQRLKAITDSEAKGCPVWTDALDQHVRQKLIYAMFDLVEYGRSFGEDGLSQMAAYRTSRELGLPRLADERHGTSDTYQAFLTSDEGIVFSLLEALYLTGLDRIGDPPGLHNFETAIKYILLTHRVSFDFIDGRIVPYESLELHQAVVVPTLTLLGGKQRFAGAEKAYQDALHQIHDGNPENAITDAGTALQEALKALDCKGNALNPLAVSAQKKGILAGHDRKLINWVEGDRSNTGDAHNAAPASTEDAWLTVHVVGAIILRVTQDTPRPSPSVTA